MSIIAPNFEENGKLLLGTVFLFSQFSPIEVINFNTKILFPIEDIDSLNQNIKKYSASDRFLRSSGSLKK